MAQETITPEEYKKKHGHNLPAEKYEKLDMEILAEKGKRYGYTICKRTLYDALHGLNPYEKVIYLALRLYADNRTNWCCPGMRELAEKLNLSKNTINKYISTLKKKKFLKIGIKRGRGGKRFEYWLLK